jgi:hypothetical protein
MQAMQQSRGGVAAAHQRARLPSLCPCPRRPQGFAGRPSLLLARADPKVEGTREFREDTGEVSGPSKKNADGSIYVDDSAPKVRSGRVCVVKTPPIFFASARRSNHRAFYGPGMAFLRVDTRPTRRRIARGEGGRAQRGARDRLLSVARRRRLVARSRVCGRGHALTLPPPPNHNRKTKTHNSPSSRATT